MVWLMCTGRHLRLTVSADCTVVSVPLSLVSLSTEVSISVCTIRSSPSFSLDPSRVTSLPPSCSDGSSQPVQVLLLTHSTLSDVVWYSPLSRERANVCRWWHPVKPSNIPHRSKLSIKLSVKKEFDHCSRVRAPIFSVVSQVLVSSRYTIKFNWSSSARNSAVDLVKNPERPLYPPNENLQSECDNFQGGYVEDGMIIHFSLSRRSLSVVLSSLLFPFVLILWLSMFMPWMCESFYCRSYDSPLWNKNGRLYRVIHKNVTFKSYWAQNMFDTSDVKSDFDSIHSLQVKFTRWQSKNSHNLPSEYIANAKLEAIQALHFCVHNMTPISLMLWMCSKELQQFPSSAARCMFPVFKRGKKNPHSSSSTYRSNPQQKN